MGKIPSFNIMKSESKEKRNVYTCVCVSHYQHTQKNTTILEASENVVSFMRFYFSFFFMARCLLI